METMMSKSYQSAQFISDKITKDGIQYFIWVNGGDILVTPEIKSNTPYIFPNGLPFYMEWCRECADHENQWDAIMEEMIAQWVDENWDEKEVEEE